MTKEEAIQAVHKGQIIHCTVDEYPEIRRALQDQAAKWIDQNDHIRAHIACFEVERLDRVHNFQLFKEASV